MYVYAISLYAMSHSIHCTSALCFRSIPRALPSTGSEYVGVSKGRFKTEFMLVAAIGHGAFGVVYRVSKTGGSAAIMNGVSVT